MTTNLNRTQSKTRDRHAEAPTRRSSRPSPRTSEGQSADEIRETVKEAVGKGVSAVAGAVEGVAETMEETELAQTAETAIHQVGGTANKVVRAAKEEAENLKHAFKGEAGEGEGDRSDEDFQIERDDPTLAGKAFTPTTPLAHGTEDDLDTATYTASEEDDESRPF